MFIAAQFTIAKCWKQPRCPSANEVSINCGTFIQCNTSQQKERRSSYPLQQHGWNWKHYAKWSKPGSERQIPHDLTYKWNLINKTNRWAKYNQRHWNKEQTERRGEEDNRGKKVKGHQGTCMRNPWAKSKDGRIEGGRWGWMGWGRVGWQKVVVGKRRWLYVNNDKKWLKKRYRVAECTRKEDPIICCL